MRHQWPPLPAGPRRGHDGPPAGPEILVPLLVWALSFEVVLPAVDLFHGLDHADPADVLWDAIGAFGAAVFWRHRCAPAAPGARRLQPSARVDDPTAIDGRSLP